MEKDLQANSNNTKKERAFVSACKKDFQKKYNQQIKISLNSKRDFCLQWNFNSINEKG